MPQWAWYLIFWAVFNVLTTLGVSVYGELEYIFGMFKFLSLIVLFFISILANVGAFGGGYVGFRYWTPPDGPLVNGINGFGQVFVLAATYYVGTEVISLAAGESKNPQRDVPAVSTIHSKTSSVRCSSWLILTPFRNRVWRPSHIAS